MLFFTFTAVKQPGYIIFFMNGFVYKNTIYIILFWHMQSNYTKRIT